MRRPGRCPTERAFFEGDGIRLFADPRNEAALKPQATSLTAALKAHFGRIGPGDYAALLAYIERSPAHIDDGAAHSPNHPRPDQGGYLRRLRAAIPAFDGAGL